MMTDAQWRELTETEENRARNEKFLPLYGYTKDSDGRWIPPEEYRKRRFDDFGNRILSMSGNLTGGGTLEE